VLGLLLYLIYTADLPETSNTTIATFADDTALLATDSGPSTGIAITSTPSGPPTGMVQ
jgi:hypothetical protein